MLLRISDSAAVPSQRHKKLYIKKALTRAACFGHVIFHRVILVGVTFLRGMMNRLATVIMVQRLRVAAGQAGIATRYANSRSRYDLGLMGVNSVTNLVIGRMVSIFGCTSEALPDMLSQECPNGAGQSKRMKSFGDQPNNTGTTSGDECFKCGQMGHWSGGKLIIAGLRAGIQQKWMIQLVPIPLEHHSSAHRLQTQKVLNEVEEVLVPEEGKKVSGDEVVRRRIILSVLQMIFDFLLRFEPFILFTVH